MDLASHPEQELKAALGEPPRGESSISIVPASACETRTDCVPDTAQGPADTKGIVGEIHTPRNQRNFVISATGQESSAVVSVEVIAPTDSTTLPQYRLNRQELPADLSKERVIDHIQNTLRCESDGSCLPCKLEIYDDRQSEVIEISPSLLSQVRRENIGQQLGYCHDSRARADAYIMALWALRDRRVISESVMTGVSQETFPGFYELEHASESDPILGSNRNGRGRLVIAHYPDSNTYRIFADIGKHELIYTWCARSRAILRVSHLDGREDFVSDGAAKTNPAALDDGLFTHLLPRLRELCNHCQPSEKKDDDPKVITSYYANGYGSRLRNTIAALAGDAMRFFSRIIDKLTDR